MTESNQKVRTNLYITKSTLKKSKEICKREGVSVSEKVDAFLLHYNQAHSNGNPQLTISAYAKPDSPQPMRVLCLFIDGAMSDGQVHCKRAGMWIPGVRCYSCDKNSLRKKN